MDHEGKAKTRRVTV